MSDVANIISNSTIYSSCKFMSIHSCEVKELMTYWILEAGEATLGTPYEMRRAAGTEIQHTTVWFIIDGEITFEIPGKTFTAGPGMAVVQSSTTNRLCKVEKGVFRHLYFYLPNRNIATTTFAASYIHELQELLHMLERETYNPVVDAGRRNMLAALISSYLEKELEGTPEPHRLRKMVELIEAHLEKKWTTTSLAAKINISPSLLYQLCICYYGESPGNIVRKIKFRHASALLRQSDESLESIAASIGYGNAFSFSKAFYKYTGRRPGQEHSKS